MADLNDPKKKDKLFKSLAMKYSRPRVLIVVGVICAMVAGAVGPSIGILITKNLFAINTAIVYGISPLEASGTFIWMMFGLALIIFTVKAFGILSWVNIASNLTFYLRKDLYMNIMCKDISWHDDRANSPGVLSAMLQADCQKMNGVSTEPVAAILEAVFSIVIGLLVGFYFSWPITLCALAILPIIMIGNKVRHKFAKKNMFNVVDQNEENKIVKMAQLLASDCIQNYKIVASFGND